MTKLTKLVDMTKIVEIEVDEVVATEIKQLKAKVTRLEAKVEKLKIDKRRAEDLLADFSQENRLEIKNKAKDLVQALDAMDWVEIDGYPGLL